MQGTNKGFLLGRSVGSVVAACFVVGAIGWAAPQAAEPQAASAPAAVRSQSAAAPLAAIDQYCVTCHDQRTQTGGLSLDVRRPDRATYDRLITSIESAPDVSPVLMEHYLVAADANSTLARWPSARTRPSATKLGKTPLDAAMEGKDRDGGLRYANAVGPQGVECT